MRNDIIPEHALCSSAGTCKLLICNKSNHLMVDWYLISYMVQTNFSFHYADPHYGGLLATPYLPHAPVSKTFLSYTFLYICPCYFIYAILFMCFLVVHAWHAHFLFLTDHRCRARPFQMFFEVLLLVFFFFQWYQIHHHSACV